MTTTYRCDVCRQLVKLPRWPQHSAHSRLPPCPRCDAGRLRAVTVTEAVLRDAETAR